MFPVGFEPTIAAGERSQTYALDRAATGIGSPRILPEQNVDIVKMSFPTHSRSKFRYFGTVFLYIRALPSC
jgi:hypothetical protein